MNDLLRYRAVCEYLPPYFNELLVERIAWIRELVDEKRLISDHSATLASDSKHLADDFRGVRHMAQ
jgi:hypothetical protein